MCMNVTSLIIVYSLGHDWFCTFYLRNIWICYCCNVGNFLVSKAPPHLPILLDFGLTKKLSPTLKQALAKMFLASAEVCTFSLVYVAVAADTLNIIDNQQMQEPMDYILSFISRCYQNYCSVPLEFHHKEHPLCIFIFLL